MKVIFPPVSSNGSLVEMELDGSAIITGANGSGKSRMGAAIMAQNSAKTTRISAQRNLGLPGSFTPQSVQAARENQRNRSSIQVHDMAGDFEALVTVLFALESDRNAEHVAAAKNNIGGPQLSVELSAIDKIMAAWSRIMPHRTLKIAKHSIMASVNKSDYVATYLSDGEKVALYLIAQVVSAPKGNIVVVDEPELHLHRSLMHRLWDDLENLRSDLQFIYITHDLDFAAGKPRSKIIWCKSFDGDSWEWEHAPTVESIPDNLMLEVLGSRDPVLFVEGEKNSLDKLVYDVIYDHLHLIPRGGCESVIQATKGMSSSEQLHYKRVRGLVDADDRTTTEIEALKQSGVHTLPLGEVENIFLLECLIKLASKTLLRTDQEKDFQDVKAKVVAGLVREFERFASKRCSRVVEYRMMHFDTDSVGVAGIQAALSNTVSSIDVAKIHAEIAANGQRLLGGNDYLAILRYFTDKGMIVAAASVFGIKADELKRLIIRALGLNSSKECLAELRRILPSLP